LFCAVKQTGNAHSGQIQSNNSRQMGIAPVLCIQIALTPRRFK
jgi:hypothetical protein